MDEENVNNDLPVTIQPGYVIITHIYTSNEFGKKVIRENCEFESKLKNKHLTGATMILDYKNLKIVKTRDSNLTFEDIEQYLKNSYGEKFQKFLTAIGR